MTHRFSNYSSLAACATFVAFCIGGTPSQAGSTRQDGGVLAVDTNWADNTVSLINLSSKQEKSVITVGAKPYDIKTDKFGRFAYTTLSGGNEISVIDLAANLEAGRIRVGESPRDFVFTSDFKRLVVANSGSNSISVVDVDSRKELFQVPVGLVPYGVGVTDDGQFAVISNWGEGTVSFVDLENRKEAKKIEVGHLPYTIAVNSKTGLAYTNAFGDDKVVVMDLKKQAVVRELPVGKSPWGLSVTADGKKVGVANFYSGSISVVDVDTSGSPTFKISTYELSGKKPGDAIIAADVARKPTDMASSETVPNIVNRPKHLAINGAVNMVMWTDLAANTVNTIDIDTGVWSGSTKVGHAPYGIDFLPQGLGKQASNY